MKFEAKLPDESVNYSNEHPLIELLKVGGTLVSAIVILYFVLGWSVDLLAKHISASFDQKIGNLIGSELFLEQNNTGLSALGHTLDTCAELEYKPRITLSDSEEVNAFALPGGIIVINQGLIDQSKSENELLFIIAHEMGHIKNRDHLRGIGRALVGLSISAMLGLSEAPDVLGSSLQFGESRFSQQQEQAADLYGLEMLQCRYGHVGGATDFFERHKENDPAKWLLFASHPELVKRIERLKDEMATKKYTSHELTPLDKTVFESQ